MHPHARTHAGMRVHTRVGGFTCLRSRRQRREEEGVALVPSRFPIYTAVKEGRAEPWQFGSGLGGDSRIKRLACRGEGEGGGVGKEAKKSGGARYARWAFPSETTERKHRGGRA